MDEYKKFLKEMVKDVYDVKWAGALNEFKAIQWALNRIDELEEYNMQLNVQMGGCLVAAEGNAVGSNDCEPGMYGHSLPFEVIKKLYNKKDLYEKTLHDVAMALTHVLSVREDVEARSALEEIGKVLEPAPIKDLITELEQTPYQGDEDE